MRAGLEASSRPVQMAYTETSTEHNESPAMVSAVPEDASVPAYQETLAMALNHQVVSDSLKDLASNARNKVRESDDPNDRWVWQKQIMLWEKKAHDEEEMADELYVQMEAERAVQEQTSVVNVPEAIQVDTVINDLTVYRYTAPTAEIEGEPGTPSEQIYTSPEQIYTPPEKESTVTDNTSTTPVQPEIATVQSQAEKSRGPIVNRFDILNQSPYSAENPIPLDVTLPEGAFYRIQLGAFSSEVEPSAFRGISPITGERIPERGLIKYYAGKFSSYEAASSALSRVRLDGYEDAFIVAWYNGNPVSTQKAKQLE